VSVCLCVCIYVILVVVLEEGRNIASLACIFKSIFRCVFFVYWSWHEQSYAKDITTVRCQRQYFRVLVCVVYWYMYMCVPNIEICIPNIDISVCVLLMLICVHAYCMYWCLRQRWSGVVNSLRTLQHCALCILMQCCKLNAQCCKLLEILNIEFTTSRNSGSYVYMRIDVYVSDVLT